MRRLVVPLAAAFVALSGLAAAPAFADEKADLAAVKACLADKADDERECLDVVAGPCMEEPDGQSTLGMSECVDREQTAWDVVLNERYKQATADAKARDAELAESLATDDPTSVADTLRTAQRAWIAYRDAECDRLWAEYQDGTIRANVFSGCQRDLTAERAMALRANEG